MNVIEKLTYFIDAYGNEQMGLVQIDLLRSVKAEIERLTEEKTNISQSYIEVCDINAKLTEEIDQRRNMMRRMDCNYATELQKNAELQKQVDELKERAKIDLENEKNWGKIQTKQLRKQVDELKAFKNEAISMSLYGKGRKDGEEVGYRQAVKDTAKEIFTAIIEEFVFSFKAKNEDYQNGYDQALTDYDNNLKNFFKERYGVEVE